MASMESRSQPSFQKQWKLIENAIAKIDNSLEEGTSTAFTFGAHKPLRNIVFDMFFGQTDVPDHWWTELRQKYVESHDNHIKSKVLPALESLDRSSNVSFLRAFVEQWRKYKTRVEIICLHLGVLDRHFPRREAFKSPPLPLSHVALMAFHNLVYKQVKNNVIDAAINLIQEEREGLEVDRSLLESIVDMLMEPKGSKKDCYQEDFELAMVDRTVSYYSAVSKSWISNLSCSEYLCMAEKSMEDESRRDYLPATTRRQVLRKLFSKLITPYATQLLKMENSGFFFLLSNDKVEDLSRMYKLFYKIPQQLEPMVRLYRAHVTAMGKKVVQRIENEKQKQEMVAEAFVREFGEFHDKCLMLENKCFMNSRNFRDAVRAQFEEIVNNRMAGRSSAELLAEWCDVIFKMVDDRKANSDDIENTAEKVVTILQYVSDRDSFVEYYIQKLIQRSIVWHKSGNCDNEKIILAKLKQEFRSGLVHKLEIMVTDLVSEGDLKVAFLQHVGEHKSQLGIDVNVRVLTNGIWPSDSLFQALHLPEQMGRCVEMFTTFYTEKYKSRRLTWMHSWGTCAVLGWFEGKQNPTELLVSPPQASALLLFNASDRMSYSDIKSQLCLSDEELERTLLSFASPKCPILEKSPNNKTVARTDYFEFNTNFTNPNRRIKLLLRPLEKNQKNMGDDLRKSRDIQIDACIVRVMKSAKVLNHMELVRQCIDELKSRFKPDIAQIKKRIESLMEKGYLERNKESPNTYNYLA